MQLKQLMLANCKLKWSPINRLSLEGVRAWKDLGTWLTDAKAFRPRARSNFPASLFPILQQDKNKGLSTTTIQWISSH